MFKIIILSLLSLIFLVTVFLGSQKKQAQDLLFRLKIIGGLLLVFVFILIIQIILKENFTDLFKENISLSIFCISVIIATLILWIQYIRKRKK